MGEYDNCFLFWSNHASGYTRAIQLADSVTEGSKDDPIVSKELVDKYKQLVVLPQYGEHKETYAGLNEFYVLPNTGQVRQALGITTLDIHLEGNRNSFTAYFKDTVIEVFKQVRTKGVYSCSLKEANPFIDEWSYYQDEVYEAETRNKAIFKFISDRHIEDEADSWQFDKRNDYFTDKADLKLAPILLAKKYITCKLQTTTVLDKWRKT